MGPEAGPESMYDGVQEIEERIEERLHFLLWSGPTDNEYRQRYDFKYLKSLCHARDRGRLNQEQRRRLQGLLRNYRIEVLGAHSCGRYVPPAVLQAIKDAKRRG